MRNGWPEVAQKACAAAAWDLPDAEEAENMIYPVCMEIPAFAHETSGGDGIPFDLGHMPIKWCAASCTEGATHSTNPCILPGAVKRI